MQGEESRSAKTKVSIGIDTSKNWLDVHVHPVDLTFRVANTKQGHKTLKRKLAVFDVELIVIEPTGKYHRTVHRSLHASGLHVAVVNPYRTRKLADALGLIAKPVLDVIGEPTGSMRVCWRCSPPAFVRTPHRLRLRCWRSWRNW